MDASNVAASAPHNDEMDFYNIPLEKAREAYNALENPTVIEQLLYAILAQLDKTNHLLAERSGGEEE